MSDVTLEVRLLGRFAVLRDGVEIAAPDFGGRKVRALLRILATRRGTLISHEVLTEMLWQDRPPADPVANLQVLVNRARRALDHPTAILTGIGGYALTDDDTITVDSEEFLAAVEQAKRQSDPRLALPAYRAALAKWRGDPLAEDAYDNWAAEYRDHLQLARLSALDAAAEAALAVGEYREAAQLAADSAQVDPLREVSTLLQVRALAAAGDRVGALERYDRYRRLLANELGLDPSADALALQQELLAGSSQSSTRNPPPTTAVGFTELPFVGRQQELEQILAAVAGPSGATIVVEGVSGAGKSRLLSVLADRTHTVIARAYRPEVTEPWSLARTLLRELLAVDATYIDQLAAPSRVALASVLPELEPTSEATDPESQRALIREALLRLLDAAGAVVAIDDVQWADPSSVAMLEAARARLPGLRLVLAVRPEELAESDEVAAMLRRVPADCSVRLSALTQRHINSLVSDSDLAMTLAVETDGTPLAIREVLRELAVDALVIRNRDERWHSVDPSAVARARALSRSGKQRAICRRADAEPPRVRQLLEVLCLIARETSSHVLADALDADEREILDGLTKLAHDGLVRIGEQGWATSHDLVSETLAERMPSAYSAVLHRGLARALEGVDADAAEIARHWRGAGDVRRAAEAYARAATHALDAFAHDEAFRLANEGLALGPDTPRAAKLHEVRGSARARGGDILGAREDLRAALAAYPWGRSGRVRLLTALATLASGADDLVRGAELAELAIVEAGDDVAARAQALEVASILDMNLDRAERSAQRCTEALERYRQIGDARGVARALDAQAMRIFLDGNVTRGGQELRRAADLFDDSGDLLRVVTPRSTSGHALVLAGQPAKGLALCEAALHLARQLGYPEGQTYALWHCAEAASALNRADDASTYAQEALTIATRLGHRGWTATAWRATGLAAEAAHDLEGALAAYQQSLQLSQHLDLFASWAAARAGLVLLRLGDLASAEPLIKHALSLGPPLGHYEARLAAVELAVARGDPDAPGRAAEALTKARTGGALQGSARLAEVAAAR